MLLIPVPKKGRGRHLGLYSKFQCSQSYIIRLSQKKKLTQTLGHLRTLKQFQISVCNFLGYCSISKFENLLQEYLLGKAQIISNVNCIQTEPRKMVFLDQREAINKQMPGVENWRPSGGRPHRTSVKHCQRVFPVIFSKGSFLLKNNFTRIKVDEKSA